MTERKHGAYSQYEEQQEQIFVVKKNGKDFGWERTGGEMKEREGVGWKGEE